MDEYVLINIGCLRIGK